MPNLVILPWSAPEGYCPTTWQQFIIDAIGGSVAVMEGSGFSVIINSATAPGPSEHSYLWFNQNDDRTYRYANGAWIARHEYPPGSPLRFWYEGDETSLLTFDGGEAGAVGDAAGPMWERDTNYNGRSFMGVGDIPGANPAKSLAVSEDYGEGAHTMTAEEVGPHTHPLNVEDLSQTPGTGAQAGLLFQAPGTGSGNPASPSTLQVQTNEYTGDQSPMPIIHPVRGGLVIQRTARIYRRAS